MAVLTSGQIQNLTDFGWDDTIGNIKSYIVEERSFIVDTNIRWSLQALVADSNSPREFESFRSLYKALKAKGLKCSENVFVSRINPNMSCNREVGIPLDLSTSTISSGQLKPFEVGIADYAGYFNREFYELASTLLSPGYLALEKGKKLSKANKQIMNSPEINKKLCKAAKARSSSPEDRKRMSEARTGIPHSLEARKKMSEAQKGRVVSQKTRENMSKAQKGKHLSQEHKEKLSKIKKGTRASPETRKKMSATRKGRRFSQETKKWVSVDVVQDVIAKINGGR